MRALIRFAVTSLRRIALSLFKRKVSEQQLKLWDAALEGDVAKAEAAIEAGADVNALDIRRNTGGWNGRFPLNFAVENDDTAMVGLLLDCGAKIENRNLSGFTALHHAAESGVTSVASQLLERGADPSSRNYFRRTPLDIAEAEDNEETANILRQA
jgi:ankyrin repeat protein